MTQDLRLTKVPPPSFVEGPPNTISTVPPLIERLSSSPNDVAFAADGLPLPLEEEKEKRTFFSYIFIHRHRSNRPFLISSLV